MVQKARVVVEPIDITANDIEDWWPDTQDEIFLTGGIGTIEADPSSDVIFTNPIKIQNKQTIQFDSILPDSERVIFDEIVPMDTTLVVGITAFEQDPDFKKIWEDYDDIVKKVSEGVGLALNIAGSAYNKSALGIAGDVLNAAVWGVDFFINLYDPVNRLGNHVEAYKLSNLSPGETSIPILSPGLNLFDTDQDFVKYGAFNTGWDYNLSYSIEVIPAITGTSGNDYLSGGSGNDLLIGLEEFDILVGGAGDDMLIGPNSDASNPGSGEYDNLIGGPGADIFVLGDSTKAYYQGLTSAEIYDFNWNEGDKVRVFGSASDYSLTYTQLSDDFPPSPLDTGIIYQGDVIGVVYNTTDVSIYRDFDFA